MVDNLKAVTTGNDNSLNKIKDSANISILNVDFSQFSHKEIYDAVLKTYGTEDFIQFFNTHYEKVYSRLDKDQGSIMMMNLYQISKKSDDDIKELILNTEDPEYKKLLILTFKYIFSDSNEVKLYSQTNDSLSNGVFTGKNIPIQNKHKTKKGNIIPEKLIPYKLCRNEQDIIERIPAKLRPIHNAVTSLVVNHNKIFTVSDLYEVYSGGKRLRYIEQAKELIQGLFDLSNIWISADVTERLKQAGKDTENNILSGQIVSFDVLSSGELTANTQIIIKSMPLLIFACICEKSPQLLSFRFKSVKKIHVRTVEGYTMRDALLRRINLMQKGTYKNSNIIDLNNFFLDLELVGLDKKKAYMIRNQLKVILNDLKKENLIKDYEFIKEGKSIKKLLIS